MSDESIYDLWRRIASHPDFAGGTIFTRDDVAAALFNNDADDPLNVTPEQVAQVTDDMVRQARRVTDNWIGADGGYSWAEAIQDLVEL